MFPPTPTQDRLARGKSAPPKPRSGTDAAAPAPTRKPSDDPYVERDDRDRAARVMASWELLAMWASAGVESIPQTRLRFEKKLIGVSEEKGAEEDEWEDSFDEEVEAGGEEARKRDGGVGGRREKGEAGRKKKGVVVGG